MHQIISGPILCMFLPNTISLGIFLFAFDYVSFFLLISINFHSKYFVLLSARFSWFKLWEYSSHCYRFHCDHAHNVFLCIFLGQSNNENVWYWSCYLRVEMVYFPAISSSSYSIFDSNHPEATTFNWIRNHILQFGDICQGNFVKINRIIIIDAIIYYFQLLKTAISYYLMFRGIS